MGASASKVANHKLLSGQNLPAWAPNVKIRICSVLRVHAIGVVPLLAQTRNQRKKNAYQSLVGVIFCLVEMSFCKQPNVSGVTSPDNLPSSSDCVKPIPYKNLDVSKLYSVSLSIAA